MYCGIWGRCIVECISLVYYEFINALCEVLLPAWHPLQHDCGLQVRALQHRDPPLRYAYLATDMIRDPHFDLQWQAGWAALICPAGMWSGSGRAGEGSLPHREPEHCMALLNGGVRVRVRVGVRVKVRVRVTLREWVWAWVSVRMRVMVRWVRMRMGWDGKRRVREW